MIYSIRPIMPSVSIGGIFERAIIASMNSTLEKACVRAGGSDAGE